MRKSEVLLAQPHPIRGVIPQRMRFLSGMLGRTPYRTFIDRIPANDNSTEDTATQTADTEAA